MRSSSDPRILVLDDATASVDAATEREIKFALREVMEGRTTLVIAHRLSTIALADRVIVLEGGRLTAQGTHEQLLDGSALYAEIVDKGMPRLGAALSGLDGGEPDDQDADAGRGRTLMRLLPRPPVGSSGRERRAAPAGVAELLRPYRGA